MSHWHFLSLRKQGIFGLHIGRIRDLWLEACLQLLGFEFLEILQILSHGFAGAACPSLGYLGISVCAERWLASLRELKGAWSVNRWTTEEVH